MISRLRKKFVVISTLSVTAVLIVITLFINITSYYSSVKKPDMILNYISSNDGMFPHNKTKPDLKIKDAKGSDIGFFMRPEEKKITADDPFMSRFFYVKYDTNGKVISIDTSNIASITSSEAEEYGEKVYNSSLHSGFKDIYRFSKVSKSYGTLVVFLDCERELNMIERLFIYSVIILFIGILSVFALVLLFSKAAMKPYAESYEKQKRFITDAGHEIKTPLTIIKANTDVIEMINGENEWTHSIRNQVDRMTYLTNSLVSLARMDEEGVSVEISDFCLSETIYECVDSYAVLTGHEEKTLESDIEKDITYKGSEQLIKQLISILLDNALKYSNQGGMIKVVLKKHGKHIVLNVYNTVDKIEKGNHDILFERFYRADDSRNSKTGGNGIGLSIAKAIVLRHKGKISCESSDEHSILFSIEL